LTGRPAASFSPVRGAHCWSQSGQRHGFGIDAEPKQVGVANIDEQPLAVGSGDGLPAWLELDRFLVADFQRPSAWLTVNRSLVRGRGKAYRVPSGRRSLNPASIPMLACTFRSSSSARMTRIRTIRVGSFWRRVVLALDTGCLIAVLPRDEATVLQGSPW
jgi:hypothetical protein